jgi:hypothetical protein
MKLKILQNTVLKLQPVQSADLSADQKEEITAGQLFELHSYKVEGKHIRVAFEEVKFKGRNTWYAFADHVRLVTSQEALPSGDGAIAAGISPQRFPLLSSN